MPCTAEADLSTQVDVDEAAREAGSMFYGAGTYGFFGYAFADLGKDYQFVSRSVVPVVCLNYT